MFVCDETRTVEYALCSKKENGLPFVLLFGDLKSLSWITNSYHDCMQSGFTNNLPKNRVVPVSASNRSVGTRV